MLFLTPTVQLDAIRVGQHLRAEDLQEALTVKPHRNPVDIAVGAFSVSTECLTIWSEFSPNPIGLYGILPDPTYPAMGIVWGMGTDQGRGKGLRLLRAIRPTLDRWCAEYPEGIHNYADARNDFHIRWCRLAGFRVTNPLPLHGAWFRYIHRTSEDNALV